MFQAPKLNLTPKEVRYKNNIQRLIEFCSYCQPYDESDVVWIYGDRVELEELFLQCNIAEKYWNKIVQHLHCPNCGHDCIDLTLSIGTKTKFDEEIEKHLAKVHRVYGTVIKEFEQYIEKYPLLAYKHKFAKNSIIFPLFHKFTHFTCRNNVEFFFKS